MIRFQELSIKWKIISTVFMAFILLLAVALLSLLSFARSTAENDVLRICRDIVVTAETARGEITLNFNQELIKPLEQIPRDRLLKSTPILMSMHIGSKLASQAGMSLNLKRPDPRNQANTPDAVGIEVLAELEKGEILEKIIREKDRIRYFRPVRATRDCLYCHGGVKGSPDPVGGVREGWKDGDIIGMMEITAPRDAGRNAAGSDRIFLFALLAVVAFGGALYVAVDRATKPLEQVHGLVEKVENGDFRDLESAVEGDGELARLVGAIGRMAGKLRAGAGSLGDSAAVLGGSTQGVVELSRKLSLESADLNKRSHSVAATAEKLSFSMSSVSSSAGQLSDNVNMVASSAEKLTSTVNEIAHNTEKASRITAEAVEFVGAATSRVGQLGRAANEISMVTEAIVEVAEQTKLLALNATIEAARAGEAGKGFAVVANEVKELAKQTNLATDDIRAKIEAMQSSSESTVTEIEGIRKIIHEVNDIVVNIASAVEKQAETTREIASNISQAASGIQDMTGNVSQTAEVSKNIAGEIATVTTAGEQLEATSRELERHALKLGDLAGELESSLEKLGD